MDSMTHLAGQYPGLWCTRCRASCTGLGPCSCCLPAQPKEVDDQVTNWGQRYDDFVPDATLPATEFLEEISRPPEPEVEVSAEPQAEVHFVADGDNGLAGDK